MEGRGEVHGFLTTKDISRAVVAHWWGTTPASLRAVSLREFRIMAEFMSRAEKARADAIEAARMGVPTPGRSTRGQPKPGDTIVTPTREDRTGRW